MYRDIDEVRLGEMAATALQVIRTEIVGLRRLLDEAETRAEYWKQHRIDVVSALNHHLSPDNDPCQDRGVEWPCDVAEALNSHLRRGTENVVPHPEVAHASREGPAEVSGDEVPTPQE